MELDQSSTKQGDVGFLVVDVDGLLAGKDVIGIVHLGSPLLGLCRRCTRL